MRAFFRWWFGQLGGLVPATILRAVPYRSHVAILDIEPGSASLIIRSRRETQRIAQAAPDIAGLRELARAFAACNPKPPVLVLRLRSEQVLRKSLSFPRAARHDLATLLGFEIDRETPFSQDEVHWTYEVRRHSSARSELDVDLFVVPRNFADPLIELARRAGLAVSAIEFDTGAQPVFHSLDKGRDKGLLSRRPLVPLTAAAALALGALAVPFVQQSRALATIDETIAALEPQAREAIALRQTANGFSQAADFFKTQRVNSGSALSVLASVTRAIPDDSYLTSLNLRNRRLTMSGLSPTAADLVGSLARSPAFREPVFDSPVVESKNGDMESFTISVNLAGQGAP